MLVHLLIAGEIRHATRAQIIAALPPVLRVQDAPDPQGEARYARVIALARRAYSPEIAKGEDPKADAAARHRAAVAGRPLIDGLDIALDGPLRVPMKLGMRFPEQASLKSLAKLITLSAKDAISRGDRASCVRSVVLCLRFSSRLVDAGGDPIDLMVAVATEAIAEKSAVDADAAGMLDDAARRRVLALLSPLRGPMLQLSNALRREFYLQRLPVLVDPVHGAERLVGADWPLPKRKAEPLIGSYDPIATARLVGRQYEAAMGDTQRPLNAQTGEATRMAAALEKRSPKSEGVLKADYERRMASVPNSIGLMFATIPPGEGLALVGVRRAARRNLTRAAILLRHGEYTPLPDPFGKGPLKIDAKRRIVYSVGENGRDDGGQIGKGLAANAPDFGYRY